MRTLWLLLSTWVLLFQNSAANHGTRLPSAMAVGTVYCDTCSQRKFTKTSYFIQGASVAVECKDPGGRAGFTKEAKTNRRGEFEVHLPFRIAKHANNIRRCSVQLVNSSEPSCSVASTTASANLKLRSRKQGVYVFSAGFFTFKPLEQPDLCYQKPSLAAFRTKTTLSSSDAKENDLAIVIGTPLPFLPLPPITIGSNPFLTPPPPVLHSDPLQPPFYNFPPVPFSSAVPAPPVPSPPPVFSYPFLPFPFPNPGPMFPGVPLAPASKEKSP